MSDLGEEGDEALNALLPPLDEAAGPARRISREKSAAMVLAALDASTLTVQAPRMLRGKRPPVWLMTGAILVAGAAAAAVWSFTRSERTSEAHARTAVEVKPPHAEAPRVVEVHGELEPAGGVHASAEAPGEVPASADAARAVPASAEVASGVPTSAEAARRVALRAAAQESDTLSDVAEVRSARPRPPSATAASPASVRAAEDLLLKANGLRSQGRWKEAESLYLRVIRAQPSSLAAYVARVASGSLRLEKLGDARGALRQFQAALRLQPRGVLDQEAQHGIAEAHRVLGDRDAERRALESFLSTHPDSPLGPAARARVQELSAR
ncbi:tetratricopeptide repeat protein [Comamonas sp. JC664]|uniref:tetratricopeptide repeat protein n=1 Tax=Comamonas sp. JC664 TaxID=2801917 RepID=UPI00174A8757|nr:tetratricopeptide repeat protein [Comamonas sp. JC664]MBL0693429.1 tetratricopeptide repeat protein [Comamonas sp. JC664]GHG72450.1 hypothetical protein GCM10012319_18440 [Comamonas sp. KCTC 72670]